MNSTHGLFWVADVNAIKPQECPCGTTRRAIPPVDFLASIHRVTPKIDARPHHHSVVVEGYYVSRAVSGFIMPLDDDKIKVEGETLFLLHPNCQHQSVGKEIIIFVLPRHGDPRGDMIFDEPEPAKEQRYEVVTDLEERVHACHQGIVPFLVCIITVEEQESITQDGCIVFWYVLEVSEAACLNLCNQPHLMKPGRVVAMKAGCNWKMEGKMRVLAYCLEVE